MAKITTIKFTFKGVEDSVNVNVNSSGQFSANIPKEVATALDIYDKLTANSLATLEKDFTDAMNRYKEAETTQEILIGIEYGARGNYQKRADGSYMFGENTHFSIQMHFSSLDVIGFSFETYIRETVDGVVNYYRALQGKNMRWDNDKYINHPEKWFKDHGRNPERMDKKTKLIPYSDAAWQTLSAGRETLRRASETLFNFISQDEQTIELALNNNKLLN